MKILLDENIHIDFASRLTGHEVYTVSQMGWASKKNGELMKLTSENGFDCFLTLDRNIKYQQNLDKYKFKVIVLFVVNSRIETLEKLLPSIFDNIREGSDGKYFEIK